MDRVPEVCAAVKTKLLPALVSVMPAGMLRLKAPVEAETKFPFVAATPVVVIVVQALVITTDKVPDAACELMFATEPVRVLHVVMVIVAVGIPVKMTLLADVDDTVVVALNVIVTVAAPVPKMKLLDVAEIDAVVAVITLLPVSGPNIETPNPAVVIVDETTVSPVAEAAVT